MAVHAPRHDRALGDDGVQIPRFRKLAAPQVLIPAAPFGPGALREFRRAFSYAPRRIGRTWRSAQVSDLERFAQACQMAVRVCKSRKEKASCQVDARRLRRLTVRGFRVSDE